MIENFMRVIELMDGVIMPEQQTPIVGSVESELVSGIRNASIGLNVRCSR